jgi:hypothetical protein
VISDRISLVWFKEEGTGTLTSASLTGWRPGHHRRADLAASSRLSPPHARGATRDAENRIAPAPAGGARASSPSAAAASPSPMGSSCQTTSREAVKSATRRAKKRWLGRHDSPGRRRLRTAAPAAAAAAEADAPAPAAGRWLAASEWAPRRHIGTPAQRRSESRLGGSDLAGLGQWELPVVAAMRRVASPRAGVQAYHYQDTIDSGWFGCGFGFGDASRGRRRIGGGRRVWIKRRRGEQPPGAWGTNQNVSVDCVGTQFS